MRKIEEILRLKYEAGLSHRSIAQSCSVSPSTVSDYVNEHTALLSTVHCGGDLALITRFMAAGFPIVIEKG